MQISELVKKLEGKLLLLGIYDKKIYLSIENNPKVTDCMILNDRTFSMDTGSGQPKGKIKKYYLKKIRKMFGKKGLDNIVCEYSEVHRKMHHFVKNSIYITNGKIYLYCDKNVDVENIKKRYNRYDVVIEKTETNDRNVLIINCEKAKNKRFKEFFYYIIDLIDWAFDYIGDILTY